jgi:hypothetical protein
MESLGPDNMFEEDDAGPPQHGDSDDRELDEFEEEELAALVAEVEAEIIAEDAEQRYYAPKKEGEEDGGDNDVGR